METEDLRCYGCTLTLSSKRRKDSCCARTQKRQKDTSVLVQKAILGLFFFILNLYVAAIRDGRQNILYLVFQCPLITAELLFMAMSTNRSLYTLIRRPSEQKSYFFGICNAMNSCVMTCRGKQVGNRGRGQTLFPPLSVLYRALFAMASYRAWLTAW